MRTASALAGALLIGLACAAVALQPCAAEVVSAAAPAASSSSVDPRGVALAYPASLRVQRRYFTAESDAETLSMLGVRSTAVVRSTPADPDSNDHIPFLSNFWAKFMAASYLVLWVLCTIQLARTIIHKHKIQSFRFGFLLVCFLWTLLRVIFWFFVTILTWPTWLSHLIYFLPNACQIGTFSLLILFYAKLVHRHRWRFLRLRFLSFCILSNTAMVLLTLTFSILMDRVSEAEAEDPSSQDAANVGDFVNQMYYVVCALFFGVLVVLAAYYIHRLRTSRQHTAGTSRQEVLLTSLIFVIFLSRCIWDMLAAFEDDSTFRLDLVETPNQHVKIINTETFLLIFLWEVLPTLMIIIYFRNIPTTSDSYCVGLWSCLPEGFARRCLASICAFPPEYFESTDYGSGDASGLHSHSPGPMDGTGGELSDGRGSLGGVGSEYHAMRGGADDSSGVTAKDSGASSQLLPPGSFVPSSSLYSPEAYAQAGSTHAAISGMQAHRPFYPLRQHSGAHSGLHGSSSGGAHGSLAHNAHPPLGLPQLLSAGPPQDLYGSPTWLNAQHPALANLTPSPNVGPQSSYPTAQQQQSSHVRMEQAQQQQQQSAASTRQLYDDDDSIGAQPQQQQQQPPTRQPMPRSSRH